MSLHLGIYRTTHEDFQELISFLRHHATVSNGLCNCAQSNWSSSWRRLWRDNTTKSCWCTLDLLIPLRRVIWHWRRWYRGEIRRKSQWSHTKWPSFPSIIHSVQTVENQTFSLGEKDARDKVLQRETLGHCGATLRNNQARPQSFRWWKCPLIVR